MVINYQKQISFLERSLKKNRLSHAYLFFGPKGSGKLEAALFFAGELGKESPEKLEAKGDLLVLSCETQEKGGIIKKKDIRVEKIRELLKKANLSPGADKKRLVIIKDAEKLTVASQNALLKTLEDPPENLIIILVADNRSRILPTVLSRCQKINFNIIKENEIISLFEENKDFFKDIFFGDVSKKMALAEELGKNASEASLKIRALTFFVREIILGKENGGDFYKFDRIDREDMFRFFENLEASREILEDTNSNPRLVLENLFLSI